MAKISLIFFGFFIAYFLYFLSVKTRLKCLIIDLKLIVFLKNISTNISLAAFIIIGLELYLFIALNFAKNKNYRILFQVPSSLLISSVGLYWFFERINFF